MTLSVLIVDDEPLARDVLQMMLQDQDDIRIAGICAGGAEAIASIHQQPPDLVFLDVQMPEMDGFAVIDAIGADHMPPVIFVTAFDQYAVRAFETHALDYLLKPFDKDRLLQSLDRARKQVRQSGDLQRRLADFLDSHRQARPVNKLAIRDKGRIHLLPTDQIEWIEADGDYIKLHTDQKTWHQHGALKAIAAKLDSHQFQRVHRSTVVNVDRIVSLEPGHNGDWLAHLQSGAKIRISRRYKDQLQPLLNL